MKDRRHELTFELATAPATPLGTNPPYFPAHYFHHLRFLSLCVAVSIKARHTLTTRVFVSVMPVGRVPTPHQREGEGLVDGEIGCWFFGKLRMESKEKR